ncbi:MAG: glycine cleavage system aminomethyltransferase GcvT [Rickettsiales bacterium]|nr:glycine cleavage system aminomethyltransferase GcvT [Rickettsiales bacterium]
MKYTTLNQTHRNQGAKMVEFAGFEMPVQYPEGMLKEHEWVRSGKIGVFDVSHMGQFRIFTKNKDPQSALDLVKFLSSITPTNFSTSTDNLAKYTVLTNEKGGIIDDLIITKINDYEFFIVLNAGCKEKDHQWILKNMPTNLELVELSDRSLIAIQGEIAEEVLSNMLLDSDLSNLPYMNLGFYKTKMHGDVIVSRTGYTGEDGFEVSIKNDAVVDFWISICKYENVKPIGLGARDSLRLEMGYPLYGHDLDDTTSPIEAGLNWVVSKNNNDFIGSARILKEKENGVARKRIGVKLLERGIAREGTEIRFNGSKIGVLSSGGFSPTLKTSIGQGYFDNNIVKIGDDVTAIVRGREIPALLHSPNFVIAKTKSTKK